MNFQIGKGGGQISRELVQAAQNSLQDNRLNAQDAAPLRAAALQDGVITRTESRFIQALESKQNQTLVKAVNTADFAPADIEFQALPKNKRSTSETVQRVIRQGRIAPALAAEYKQLFGETKIASLLQVKSHYQQRFANDPKLTARLSADPVGGRIHALLTQPHLFTQNIQDLESLLQRAGYSLTPKDKHGFFDLRTFAALESVLNSFEDRPATPEAVHPLPSGEFAELPPESRMRALMGIAELEQLGLPREDALELMIGMASLEPERFNSQLTHLLKAPGNQQTVALIQEARGLLEKDRFSQIRLRDIGQLLITQNDLDELTQYPPPAQSRLGDEVDLDLGNTLKARLMTYFTLADAGSDTREIANLLKEGRIPLRTEAADFHGSYDGLEHSTSSGIRLAHNQPAFSVSLKNLFKGDYDARLLRGKIVHEAVHARDDQHQLTGLSVRDSSGNKTLDPVAEAKPRIQNSLEGEFNAYYREAQYLARELKRDGQYSKQNMIAALAWNHPKFTPMTELIDFIESHRSRSTVSEAELKALYDKVVPGLTKAYAYDPAASYINNGVRSEAIFELTP